MRILILAAIIFISCNSNNEGNQRDVSQQAAEQIWTADTAMSNLATREGFLQALIKYADDSVIIPRPGKLPLIGRADMAKEWADRPLITERTWKPIRAEAAQSGEIGYSFGYSIYKTTDTTTYSNYCTIWKKQKDGSWKFVYDAGNDIPPPADQSFFK